MERIRETKKMTACWYVLHSKPNNEELLWEQLSNRKVETFYPRIRVKTINPRARKVRPYFPGYVFIHADLEQIAPSTLQWMPGTRGFVSFDNHPSMVPDTLIHIVKKRVEEINFVGGELFDGLKQGDLVEIQSGPFAGYEAIFDARLPGSERVKVLLKMLQGKSFTKMEIPARLLKRKRETSQYFFEKYWPAG
jgi:transcription elongation factor/antiterminator RfaH